VNPDTYELLLQARSLAQRESTEGRKQAIALYRRILVSEPRFAVAWAEMAHAYMGLGRFGGLPIAEGMREARAAAQQALSLDPDQPVGLDTLAWVQRTADWDWRGAQRSFERAMALAPGDPGIRSDAAVLYFNIGRVEEAIALARQAVERDPLNVVAQFYLGAILEINGRFEESLPPLTKAVELAPAADEFHAHVARALISLGRLREAEQMVEREPNETYRLVARAQLRHAQGDHAGAGTALDELIAKYGAEIPGYVALTCAVLGDPEQAFAWLDRALARRDAAVAWVKTNYYLRSLHGDPRWPTFLARLGLADDQLK
jgi:tetratricopeptide (TPR) repeat protein